MELCEKLLESYDEVIHIPMSSGLSSSCETAMALAQEFDGKVHVIEMCIRDRRKGVNVPNVPVRLPAITDKDREDIRFGVEQEIDFIAASFVRNAECILEIKAFLRECGAPYIPIIAKIENAEGIKNIDEIIRCADGIMAVSYTHLGIPVVWTL